MEFLETASRRWVTTYLPRGRWLDWWSGAVQEGPTTLRRQAPLRELPLYLRENSLLALGPERSHVGERPADPLTVEAFVSTAAEFTLRHAGTRVGLSARRERGRLVFEASEAWLKMLAFCAMLPYAPPRR